LTSWPSAHPLTARTPGRAIWSGADNLLVGGKFGPRAAAAAVKTAMKELEKAGARHLLIFNMPKRGDTPDAQMHNRKGGPTWTPQTDTLSPSTSR